MRVTVVRLDELGVGELERWRELQRESPVLENPFLSPEFGLAVAHARTDVYCGVLEAGNDVVGFFPFERRRGGIGRPVGAGLSDCQSLIQATDIALDPLRLLRACGLAVWEFDRLLASQRSFEPFHRTRWRSLVIDLADGWPAYVENRRRASRSLISGTLRKQRQLEQEVGELRFALHTPSRDRLRQLVRLKSGQYRRTGLPDRFSKPWIVRIVEELSSTDSGGFAGVVSVLEAGDRLIAGNIMLRQDTVLCGWFPVYDPAYARFSPGMIHRLSLLEAAAGAGIQRVELGREGQPHKERLANAAYVVAEGAVERPSVVSVARRLQREPTRMARELVIRNPSLYRAARHGLRLLGRTRRTGR
jgi:CelD/BcsL family acetyltransferase involved in cellulose biosynthesis